MVGKNFNIDDQVLVEITEILNSEVDPAATEGEVLAFIDADWPNADEHQEWLDGAEAEEIADWIIHSAY
ncbi:hypothetical protein GF380_00390 [Candidatus Uhrbacteria bacterium]|nr:hypothetical protein [Candidatus Uhrbacteria bacterium]